MLSEKLPREVRARQAGQRGARRAGWVASGEPLEQRRVHAQCAQRAERCGPEEADVCAQLDRAPASHHDRGLLVCPTCHARAQLC